MTIPSFLTGLILLALALGWFTFTTDLTASSNIAMTIGQAVGGVLGALILGFIIWAPLRLTRGADRAPDVRRFTLYTAAGVVVGSILYRVAFGG